MTVGKGEAISSRPKSWWLAEAVRHLRAESDRSSSFQYSEAEWTEIERLLPRPPENEVDLLFSRFSMELGGTFFRNGELNAVGPKKKQWQRIYGQIEKALKLAERANLSDVATPLHKALASLAPRLEVIDTLARTHSRRSDPRSSRLYARALNIWVAFGGRLNAPKATGGAIPFLRSALKPIMRKETPSDATLLKLIEERRNSSR